MCLSFITNAQEKEVKKAINKKDFNISLNFSYLTPYTFDSDYSNSGAPVGLGVSYAVSNRFVVGLKLGFFNLTTKDFKAYEFAGYDSFGDPYYSSYNWNASINCVFFMGSVNYHWLVREKFSLYSGFSLGSLSGSASINFSDGVNRASVTYAGVSGASYQFTFFGIQNYFGKHFGYHVELGYGTQGIANGGIDFKF